MSQHFENENISFELNKAPGCRVHLDITVSPKATEAAYHKAVKNINKEISLPGFRKGKAPESLIVKNYGKHIESEWRDILLNTAFKESLALSKVMPFNEKSVNNASIKKINLTDGATIAIDYETQPDIPHINPEDLKSVHQSKAVVSDQEVNDSIEQARLMKAEWNEVLDRGVKEGDYVDLDIVTLETPSQILCKDTRFEVAADKMGKWMYKLIQGLNAGESAEGMSEQDKKTSDCQECADGTHTHPEFKPTQCRITVKKIFVPQLPELNDEFAKTVNCQTMAELKSKIQEDLTKRAERDFLDAQRKQMENQLLKKYSFEIPFSLVSGQMEDRKADIVNELSEHHLDPDTLQKQTDKIAQDVQKRVEHDFQLYFLTNKIAQDNQLSVTQEELMGELMHQLWLRPSGQSYIHDSMDPQEVRSRLYSNVLINKALDFLIEKANKT